MDAYILSELEILKRSITQELDAYELHKACSHFPKFFDNLTNWYIRRSRRRFWAKNDGENKEDKEAAYSTLYHVLLETVKTLAPICPFISESIYQNLIALTPTPLPEGEGPSKKFPLSPGERGLGGEGASVHHQSWSELNEKLINEDLSEKVGLTQNIISLGLSLRKQESVKVRQPLKLATIAFAKDLNISDQINTIKEELNVKELCFLDDPEKLADIIVKPNAKLLGPRFGKKVQEIIKKAKSGNFEKVSESEYLVCGEKISSEELEIAYIGKEGKGIASGNGIVVSLDFEITKELQLEGQARDLVRMIQEMRKEADYDVSDRILLDVQGADEVLEKFSEYICSETLGELASVESADREKELDGVRVAMRKNV